MTVSTVKLTSTANGRNDVLVFIVFNIDVLGLAKTSKTTVLNYVCSLYWNLLKPFLVL